VRDLPWTIEKLKQLPPFEFENWAVIALGGIPNKVQVGDMGLDGRIFPVGTKPTNRDSMFADDWFPIQVKQTDKVGRPDIDPFEAVMEREAPPLRRRPPARLLRRLRLFPRRRAGVRGVSRLD